MEVLFFLSLRNSNNVRKYHVNGYLHLDNEKISNNYLVDNNDPDKYYSVLYADSHDTSVNRKEQVFFVGKFNSVEKTNQIIKCKSFLYADADTVSNSSQIFKGFIGQTDKFVYMMFGTSISSSYQMRGNSIATYDKLTDEIKFIQLPENYYVQTRFLGEDENNFYFVKSYYEGSPRIVITRLNKSSNTFSNIQTINYSNNGVAYSSCYNRGTTKFFNYNNLKSFIEFLPHQTNPYIKMYQTSDYITFTEKTLTIVFNDDIDHLPMCTVASEIGLTLECKIVEEAGKKFLVFYFINVKSVVNEGLWKYPNEDFHYIYSFLIDEVGNRLVAQKRVALFKDDLLRATVHSDLSNNSLFACIRGVVHCRFSVLSGNYEIVNKYDIPPSSLGFDKEENIWIIDRYSNDIHKFGLEIPYKLDIKFDKKSYNYSAEDVPGNLIVNVFDSDNKRISVNLKLVFKGSAKFNNELKEIEITTSSTEDLIVPFKVYDSGLISVYPKLIF